MQKKSKVLFVVKDARYFLSHRADLARALRAEKIDVILATDLSVGGDSSQLKDCVDFCLNLPFLSAKSKPVYTILCAITVIYEILKLRPACIFTVTYPANVLGGFISRLLGVPQLVLFAGLGNLLQESGGFKSKMATMILRNSLPKKNLAVIVQNAAIGELLTRNKIIESYVPVTLIPGSGLNFSAYYNRREILTGIPRVALVSRLLREKGVIEFMSACKILRDEGFACNFELAGDVDGLNPTAMTLDEITTLATSCGVQFIGFVSDVPTYLQTVDILCLPSYHEGLPRSLLEGAASGCVLVATDIAGCRDVVTHEESGLLVEPRSAIDLADKLRRILENRHYAQSLARACTENARNRFSSDVIIPIYCSVIKNIVKASSSERKDL